MYTARDAHLDERHTGQAAYFAATCHDCNLLDKAFDWLQRNDFTSAPSEWEMIRHQMMRLYPGGWGQFGIDLGKGRLTETETGFEAFGPVTVISAEGTSAGMVTGNTVTLVKSSPSQAVLIQHLRDALENYNWIAAQRALKTLETFLLSDRCSGCSDPHCNS